MTDLIAYIPSLAGGLVVSAVVITSGGSIIQSGIAGVTTIISSLATSTVVDRSQKNRQKNGESKWLNENSSIELLQQTLLDLREQKHELSTTLENLSKTTPDFNQMIMLIQEIKFSIEKLEGKSARHLHNLELVTTKIHDSSRSVQEIVNFLESRNIKIKHLPPDDPTDDIINSLAKFLGDNYTSLRELLIKIKRNMQHGLEFHLSLKDYPQKEVSSVCQFCTKLHDIAFLEKYEYYKSPQYLIKAKTATLPLAQNFFAGRWLERYALLTIQRCVDAISKEQGREIAYSYLLNPQIILPNGDDFELDLIFSVDSSFFWIETKSGDYQQHINKYSKISKILNLDYKHSIMVLPDITEDKCDALTSLFAMTVCSLFRLPEIVTATIVEDCKSS